MSVMNGSNFERNSSKLSSTVALLVSMGKLFEDLFRESMVLEISWENKIVYKIENSIRKENFKKVSFFKLIKKYFSKKIRSLYK